MADGDLAHIREGVEELKTALAVHSADTRGYVERIVSAEERVAEAVTNVAESTRELKNVVIEMRKQNGNSGGRGIQLDRKTLMWLVGLAVAGAAALGGGQEVAHRVFDAVVFPAAAHDATGNEATP